MAVVLASPGPRLGLASGTDEATPPPTPETVTAWWGRETEGTPVP